MLTRLVHFDQPRDLAIHEKFDIPGVTCAEGQLSGVFDLWEMRDGELRRIVHFALCEQRSLAEIIERGVIRGWTTPEPYDERAEETVYTWDGEQFIATVNVEVTPTPTDEIWTDLWIDGATHDDYVRYLRNRVGLIEGVDAKLQFLDDELHAPYIVGEAWLIATIRYHKIKLLRETGREDDLLAEYVAIYELDPESRWGKWARLYFE
jgi:hypothetical protein